MKRKRQTPDPSLEFSKTCQAFTNKFTAASTPKTSFQKFGEYVGLHLSEMPQKEALVLISEIDKLFLKKAESHINLLQTPSAKAIPNNVQVVWSEQNSLENIIIYQVVD